MQNRSSEQKRVPNLRVVIPLGLFLFALLIRLLGIGWGLKNDLHNASYHPDEPTVLMFSRVIVPGQGQFMPAPGQRIQHFYSYGTLYLSLLRVASDVTTTYTGAPQTKGDGFSAVNPLQTDWDWVSRCHMAGRLISAVAGAGTVLVLYLALLRFLGGLGAGAAALAVALAPAHVVHSRFQTVDILATFFLAASAFFALRLLDPPVANPEAKKGKLDPGLAAALWCGVFAGLGAGTKYTGILAIFSLYAALAIAKRPRWAMEAAAGTLAAIVVFLVTTPGALLDRDNFLLDFKYEMLHTSTGHETVFTGTASGYLFHAANLMVGMGPLLVALGIAGLVWAAWRKHQWAWVLLAFLAPYYLLIGHAEVKFIRYTFPLYVGLAAGFGYAVSVGQRKGGWGRIAVGAGILAIGGVPTGGLRGTIEQTGYMMGEDPRDACVRDLRKTAPLATVGLARDPWFWTPPFFPDAADPVSVPRVISFSLMREYSSPPTIASINHDGSPTFFDPRLVTEMKPDRICLTSFQVESAERLKGQTGFPAGEQTMIDVANGFLDKLKGSYTLEKTYGQGPTPVHDMEYIQPVVYIWKRNDLH